jgi:hypothetical protein
MSFIDLFRKQPKAPLNPKVLVCSLGPTFEAFIREDEGAYRRFSSDMTIKNLADANDLLSEVSAGYDIVHLYTTVTPDGCIGTSNITGTKLIERATSAGTKLLWIANGNDPAGYIKNFKLNRNRLNLVMTIDRLGTKFPDFLRELFGEMNSGASMPVAWNRIVPQIPGRDHPDAPATIFSNGLGQTRFI